MTSFSANEIIANRIVPPEDLHVVAVKRPVFFCWRPPINVRGGGRGYRVVYRVVYRVRIVSRGGFGAGSTAPVGGSTWKEAGRLGSRRPDSHRLDSPSRMKMFGLNI